MDINKILAEYDAMFGKNSLEEIEYFLMRNLQQAVQQKENRICVTLLNEIIGLCRDTSQKEKALLYCRELKALIDGMDLGGSVEYATALLNIANAYRAFGLLNEASDYYYQVLTIYDSNHGTPGFLYASLYNNWSHVYQARGDYRRAVELLKEALELLMAGNGNDIMQATTRVNLATAMMQTGSFSAYNEAIKHLTQALYIFEQDGGKDFHYSAALVAMGDACVYKKEYQKAADYYRRGLTEIERHTGRNANYYKTLEKLQDAESRFEVVPVAVKGSNIDSCRAFYEQYGRAMIHNEFPEYESRIAVGLAGEGSDCYGFDDEISADHDYAPGFCMWLTNEDYDKIGAQLQKAYDRLVETVYQYKPVDRFLKERRGVTTIRNFYNRVLRDDNDYQNSGDYEFWHVPEHRLAEATNGQVFRDDLGIFTGVRKKLLSHYPEDMFRRKLAQEMHEFSQYAQSNYPRMMARGDQLTANLCISKAVESAMNMCYLLHREYAPYYKWKRKGLNNLSDNEAFRGFLDEISITPCQKDAWVGVTYSPVSINTKDRIVTLFESVAGELVAAMQRRGLITSNELFLEALIPEILDASGNTSTVKEQLIREVMSLEWKQFDKVHNEGGRAACQDDYDTFRIMRLSQYMVWPENLLRSFIDDLKSADSRGWNLITEKYGRMMKNTAPEQYKYLENQFPFLSEERSRLQETIILIQVGWMENFANEFPAIAGGSRKIHSYEDSLYETSYETYLRGEISTYSEETFVQYASFIMEALKNGRNIAREIMQNTAVLYGYKSLEDAEAKQKNRR